MFALTLSQANHTRRYSAARTGLLGWEIRCEQDSKLQRLDHYQGWHRVERALAQFAYETSRLLESGWRVIDAQSTKR
jgi:hypothetical protein